MGTEEVAGRTFFQWKRLASATPPSASAADGPIQHTWEADSCESMTILGSPRRHGNTAKALGWVEEQLRADGHEVDHINILDYNVGGCRECLVCKKGGSARCASSTTTRTGCSSEWSRPIWC